VTIEWQWLAALMTAGDFAGIATVLRDLTPAEREALVAPLIEFEQEQRQAGEPAVRSSHKGVFTVAAAAILPTAEALAPWIGRYGWHARVGTTSAWLEHDPAALALDLLLVRKVRWLEDLAQRLARATELDFMTAWFVGELCACARVDLPVTDGMALAWAAGRRFARADEIDPIYDPLLPRLFDVAGAGRLLEVEGEFGLGRAVVTFAASGRLDRADLIDRCVGALRRGGRLDDVRGYLAVHDELRPAVPEVVARVRDYLALLADGHESVATVAQRELFRADDAGRLAIRWLVDASRVVFSRAEGTLVRTQLDRCRVVLDRMPWSTDDVLPTVAMVWRHTVPDLQRDAVDLVVEYGARASAPMRMELTAAAEKLSAGHRRLVVTALSPTS